MQIDNVPIFLGQREHSIPDISVIRVRLCLALYRFIQRNCVTAKKTLQQILAGVDGDPDKPRLFMFRTLGIPQSPTEQQLAYIVTVLPGVRLNLNGCAAGILYTVRFFITTFTAQTIFETTSSLEIKGAVESVQDGIAHIFPPLRKWNPALVISLAINFIPQIFDTWSSVRTAARARTLSGKKSIAQAIRILYQEIQSLISCLLFKAETTRKAILNRGAL